LKCPHSIEPHQIQGLDCIHIFPVVQWLVREAVRAMERYGDNVRQHAVYQFAQRFRFSKDNEVERRKNIFLSNCRNMRSRCSPQRIYKLANDFKTSNLQTDVRCTLLEYGWKAASDATLQKSAEAQAVEDTTADPDINQLLKELPKTEIPQDQKQRLSTKTLAQFIDVSELADTVLKNEADTAQQRELPTLSSASDLESQIAKLEEEEKFLDDSLRSLQQREKEQIEEMNEIDARIADFDKLVSSHDKETVERLKHLLMEHDEIRKRETDFKAHCRSELKKLDEELERLNPADHNRQHGDNNLTEPERSDEERLNKLRLELADLNRQIAAQHRIVDAVPAQTEITQYQRRIIELYNHSLLFRFSMIFALNRAATPLRMISVVSKHRETKQFYILHNTLVDIQTFMKRELDMLNSIEDVQEMASRENYKESFIENLQKISKGVEASLDKILIRQKELQTRKDALSDEYQSLLEKERLFYKTVEDFKNVMAHAKGISDVLEPAIEFSENFKNFGEGMPCAIGIDEAGRGPVLGPMIYACAVSLVGSEDIIKEMGIIDCEWDVFHYCVEVKKWNTVLAEEEKLTVFHRAMEQCVIDVGADDSKVLTEAKRESIFAEMKQHTALAYGYRVLSAQMISAAMLRRKKCSLNELSHDSAIKLLQSALLSNINITEAYVDTVGPKQTYQAMLQEKFPGVQITVSEKADSKFPIVGAASIVAKGDNNLTEPERSDEERLNKLRLELADLNRQIAAQHRIVDAVPAQTEITQYQRRIIELYNHSFPSLFVKDQLIVYSLSTVTDQFYYIICSVMTETFFGKIGWILIRQKELQTRKDALSDEYQSLLEKERLFYKTVEDFKNVMARAKGISDVLEPAIEFSENFKNFGEGMPCAIGIDEAGRGPVLGPMVYACAVSLVSSEDIIKEMGADDSKVLTEAKRESIFAEMQQHKAYVDTVGPKQTYQAMLQEKFPGVQITVSEKADSKFPIVGAASIVAKVKRDEILRDWTFPEGDICTPEDGYGSGYPGEKRVYEDFREDAERPHGTTITSFFRPCAKGQTCAPPKSQFFLNRCLSNISNFSDF
uniref:Ribonuclease n=1 Tax=Gongylonema pulchrum TaxID=637853 RepID=A0A183DN68_9BILA